MQPVLGYSVLLETTFHADGGCSVQTGLTVVCSMLLWWLKENGFISSICLIYSHKRVFSCLVYRAALGEASMGLLAPVSAKFTHLSMQVRWVSVSFIIPCATPAREIF